MCPKATAVAHDDYQIEYNYTCTFLSAAHLQPHKMTIRILQDAQRERKTIAWAEEERNKPNLRFLRHGMPWWVKHSFNPPL